MSEKPTPRWRPIADLPIVASILDSMLHDDEGQYRTLLECKPKPYVLDDHTVDRVIRVFTQQKGDLLFYGEQLALWTKEEDVTATQRREVERLKGVLIKLRQVGDAILVLAEELKQETMDRVLSKSDAELGLEFLMGKWEL